MANTSNTGASTAKNSVENSETTRLELIDLKSYRLGETELNARHCSFDEFVSFAQGLVQIANPEDLRTVFNRRDFLNWCLENNVLHVEGDKLVVTTKLGDTD